MSGPLHNRWVAFSRIVLPKDASQVQRAEMEKAFFAGADELYFLVMNGLSPDKEPTDEDLALMERIHNELSDWRKKVTKGAWS